MDRVAPKTIEQSAPEEGGERVSRPLVLLETTPQHGPGGLRGLGRYVRELNQALRTFADVSEFTLTSQGSRVEEFLNLPRRQRALHSEWDLFHAPTAYHVPLQTARPWVVSILDTIPLDVDTYRRSGIKASFFHKLSTRADSFLTLSDFSAGRLVTLLGIPRERIVVAPLPVARSLVAPLDAQLPSPLQRSSFALAMVDLSRPDPRKRAAWLSGIGQRLAQRDIPLVVVGRSTDGPSQLPYTVGLGPVDDEMWATLLRDAGVFVYTSAYEGQGLPPLEAMAAGVAVVAMGNTAVSEVVRDVGVLIPERQPAGLAAAGPHSPNDPPVADLADAVLGLFADRKAARALTIAGLERAAEFSAPAFASRVAEASAIALGRDLPGQANP